MHWRLLRGRALVPAVLTASVLLFLPLPVRGAASPVARLVDVVAASNGHRAELFEFSHGLAPRLLGVATGEEIRIDGWPVAPGRRAEVTLLRGEIYAPGAKIYRVEGRRITEVPRSRLLFFWGAVVGEPERRVFVQLDPDSGLYRGLSFDGEGAYELREAREVPGLQARTAGRYVLGEPELFFRDPAEARNWRCGESDLADPFAQGGTRSIFAPSVLQHVTDNLTSMHTAVVAVDTDNELMSVKFGYTGGAPPHDKDSVTALVNNYLASLFAQMNVIYNRDLFITLLLGQTILRFPAPDGGPDPYSQLPSGGAASGSQLTEFSNYWATSEGSVTRALATMISGKGGTSFWSGIAWVGSLCSTQYGYSFFQPSTSGTSPGFADVLVEAHEIGHNFGSPHTHCYSPPIDFCYNSESGCYSGTKSCPAATTYNGVTNVTGTLMSYCHLSGLAGCSSSLVFHPRSISETINPEIDGAVGLCVFPFGPGITTVSPNRGGTKGGTSVTITGANFHQSAVAVSFGGTAGASPVTSNCTAGACTTITVTAPGHGSGAVNVMVTNTDDSTTATATNGFTYATTSVGSVSPPTGPTAGGTAVTIRGDNFQSGATVKFGANNATAVTVVNLTTITATAPACAGAPSCSSAKVAVQVTNTDATTASLTNGFFYADAGASLRFNTLSPCRVFDTRNPNGPQGGPALATNGTRVFTVTGFCNIPAGAVSVSVNLTVVTPAAGGFVAAYPGNAFPLGTSNVSFGAMQTRASNAVLMLATDGSGTLGFQNSSAGATHLLLDVNGYFAP